MKSFVSGNRQQPSPQKKSMGVIENLTASSRQEEEPLDAYSRTVREVTEKLEPTVISVGLPNGRGGGSGVIIGSDGESACASSIGSATRGERRYVREEERR